MLAPRSESWGFGLAEALILQVDPPPCNGDYKGRIVITLGSCYIPLIPLLQVEAVLLTHTTLDEAAKPGQPGHRLRCSLRGNLSLAICF